MVFNSIDFAVFLPIVFLLYWSIGTIRRQNLLLAAASYVFYGWWDWRFLSLILFSTVVDFLIGLGLSGEESLKRRRALLLVSVTTNLGILGVFKYYNFFLQSLADGYSLLGQQVEFRGLEVVLPVGISFYTFQTLSYTFDVYRQKMSPTRDAIAFASYVSFFPQLVAGPIERAGRLLPQFSRARTFNYTKAVDGSRQILWGLFKKVVVADSCAEFVDLIFSRSGDYGGSTLVVGALLFTFQIYGDFSGYSDIAIGTAKLFGFSLMQNFAYPYFSRDIAEFWRRWHISLSTWFRDYLYIPMGGSRGGMKMKIRNTFVIFIVSGLWHGANWTFIVWGALNALYFLPLLLTRTNRQYQEVVAQDRTLPSPREVASMTLTFSLTVLAWIFFRAESVRAALAYLAGIASPSLLSVPSFPKRNYVLITALFIMIQLMIEWVGRRELHPLAQLDALPRPVRWGACYALAMLVVLFGGAATDFIYFQF